MNDFSDKKRASCSFLEDSHLPNQMDNPCARIACRGRKLEPTVCDGTCFTCRGEREQYIEKTALSVMRRINADSSRGGSLEHDAETITFAQAVIVVRGEVALLDEQKELYIARAKMLA
jgi:hypothetical protein